MIQTYDVMVSAGGSVVINLSGRYMRVIKSTAAVTIGFWERGNLKGKAVNVNAGLWVRPERNFDSLTIESATAQTVSVMVGAGEAGYDQVTVSGGVQIQQASAIAELAPVSVGVTATALLAADSTRRGVRFRNNGTAAVYLGSAGVTTVNGAVCVLPGQTWTEDEAPAAAWYGISGTAGQSVAMQVLT